jgi:hypothetical protein
MTIVVNPVAAKVASGANRRKQAEADGDVLGQVAFDVEKALLGGVNGNPAGHAVQDVLFDATGRVVGIGVEVHSPDTVFEADVIEEKGTGEKIEHLAGVSFVGFLGLLAAEEGVRVGDEDGEALALRLLAFG